MYVPSRAIERAAGSPVQRGRGLLYANLFSKSWTFNMQPLRIVVPVKRGEDVVYQHEGEQWMYVLSGRLSLKLGDEEFVLEAGDAAHFDAATPHRFFASGGATPGSYSQPAPSRTSC